MIISSEIHLSGKNVVAIATRFIGCQETVSRTIVALSRLASFIGIVCDGPCRSALKQQVES